MGKYVNRSLFVTCVGAYGDSGVGTGGFVCYHKDKVTVIDKLDSTGLCKSNNKVFRYVRSIRYLLGYDKDGICIMLKLPEARDIHDILVLEDEIVCVSTGTNEIHWYNFKGELKRQWKANGEGDAWHLNSIIEHKGEIYASAFGKFNVHREWLGSKGKGIVFKLPGEQIVLSDLSGPHHPLFVNDKLFVCDSHNYSVKVKEADGNIKTILLNGFTRGMTCDDHFLYVGVSSNRKAEKLQDTSFVHIIDIDTLNVTGKIEVPFPEIYEIVLIDDELADMAVSNPAGFAPGLENDRIRALEQQVIIGEAEITRLRNQLSGKYSLRALWNVTRNKVFGGK